MPGIPGANDPDHAVAFDDLAEFASALYRSSDFHLFSVRCLLFSLTKNKNPVSALTRLFSRRPKAHTKPSGSSDFGTSGGIAICLRPEIPKIIFTYYTPGSRFFNRGMRKKTIFFGHPHAVEAMRPPSSRPASSWPCRPAP